MNKRNTATSKTLYLVEIKSYSFVIIKVKFWGEAEGTVKAMEWGEGYQWLCKSKTLTYFMF